jgi:hypothetical protein
MIEGMRLKRWPWALPHNTMKPVACRAIFGVSHFHGHVISCYINLCDAYIYIDISCYQRVFLIIVDLYRALYCTGSVCPRARFSIVKQKQLHVLDLGGQCDDNVIIRQESLLAEQARDVSKASVGLESLNTLSRKPIIRDLSDIDHLWGKLWKVQRGWSHFFTCSHIASASHLAPSRGETCKKSADRASSW